MRKAAQARTGEGRAVIGAESREDLLLLWLSPNVVVVPDDLDLRVVGLGARAAEEDLAHPAGRERDESLRQAGRGRVRHRREGVVVGEPARLLRERVHDLVPAVSDVDAPESRHPVQVLPAGGVADVDAGALYDHPGRGLRVLGRRGERVQMGPAVRFGDRGGQGFGLAHRSGCWSGRGARGQRPGSAPGMTATPVMSSSSSTVRRSSKVSES